MEYDWKILWYVKNELYKDIKTVMENDLIEVA